MNLNKTDKTLIICSIFIAGIASTLLNLLPWCFGFFLAAAFLSLREKIISGRFGLICLLILIFAVFYTNHSIPKPDYLSQIAPVKADLIGRVITQPKNYSGYKSKFELEVDFIKTQNTEWKTAKSKTLVTIFDKKENFKNINIGDLVKIWGNVVPPSKASNPGQFDYGKYLANSGIFTMIYVGHKNVEIIAHPKGDKWFFLQELNKIKDKIISAHSNNLKSPNAEVLGGVVFGDYAVPTPKDIDQNFIAAGLSHILAASGMNVAFIFGFWIFFASRLLMPYRLSISIGGLLVLFYALLTGLPPSVARATWMLEFVLLGKLINRQTDSVTLIALVCAIMLLIDPMIITSISFQLSFIVTFGLFISAGTFIDKLKPVPEIISGAVLIPVIAQIWASPIQIFIFNNFAVYSVIANIIVMPAIGIITFLGFTSSIFALIPLYGQKICWLLDKCVDPLVSFLIYVPKIISELPNALYYFATPKISSVLLIYAIILAITVKFRMNLSNKNFSSAILVLIGALGLTLFTNPFSKELKLLFFDVGKSDAAFIKMPDNTKILINAAGEGKKNYSPAKGVIIPYFRDIGVRKLDTLILTHSDKNYTGGTDDIIKNIKINRILANKMVPDPALYDQIRKNAVKNNIPFEYLTDNERLSSDKNIMVRMIRSENNGSLISLYLKYKNFSILFLDDTPNESLDLIRKNIKPPIDILKIWHNANISYIDESLLEFLKPKTVIISGLNPKHNNDSRIMSVLKKFNVKILDPNKDRAIEVENDGSNSRLNLHRE